MRSFKGLKHNSIFEYDDFRSFLQDIIDSRKLGGSQKFLADIINCQQAYLSRILKGRAFLSLDQAHRITTYFEFSFSETEYFFAMIEKEKSGTHNLKNYFENKLNLLRRNEAKSLSSMGAYKRQDHPHLEGWHKCIRPLFSEKNKYEIYYLKVEWNDSESCFIFCEKKKMRSHKGKVYIPPNLFFIYFVTIENGLVRKIVMPDIGIDGEKSICGALFCATAIPHKNTFIPASAQMLIEKSSLLKDIPDSIIIDKNSSKMSKYLAYFEKDKTPNILFGL